MHQRHPPSGVQPLRRPDPSIEGTTLARMRLRVEIGLARLAGRSLAPGADAAAERRFPGRVLAALDPGAVDALAARLPHGSRARERDERQDDHGRDGRRDPRGLAFGSRTTARARISCPASPPRSSPARTRSSGSSRSTRPPSPRWRAARSPRALVPREPLPRPARPLRRARDRRRALAGRARRARSRDDRVVNADDPLLADLVRGRESAVRFGLSDPSRRARAPPPRRRLEVLRPLRDALRRTTRRTSATSATTAARRGDDERPPLDVTARAIELDGLDGAVVRPRHPGGVAPRPDRAPRPL